MTLPSKSSNFKVDTPEAYPLTPVEDNRVLFKPSNSGSAIRELRSCPVHALLITPLTDRLVLGAIVWALVLVSANILS